MHSKVIASSLFTPSQAEALHRIEFYDGLVTEVSLLGEGESRTLIAPAFLDVHVHGARSFDFMSATDLQMDEIGAFLATKGVGAYLATTVTGPLEKTLRSLDALGGYMNRTRPPAVADMLGIHLEGPFLCPAKRGVHALDQLLLPDMGLFGRLQEAAQGHIKLITVAPEMPGALNLIRYATEAGVRVSLGHSNATEREALAGIEAGATSATHTFNAMRAIDHREPGIAGAVLDAERVYAELIADGIHVHPAMVRLWLKAKGAERAILVTDGMAATGMPDGTYHLGDLVVEVRDGVCMSGGVLAGSVLTMDRAVRNVREMTGVSLRTAVGLASRNPAAMLGMNSFGELKPGDPASFNLYDSDAERSGLWLKGHWVPAS